MNKSIILVAGLLSGCMNSPMLYKINDNFELYISDTDDPKGHFKLFDGEILLPLFPEGYSRVEKTRIGVLDGPMIYSYRSAIEMSNSGWIKENEDPAWGKDPLKMDKEHYGVVGENIVAVQLAVYYTDYPKSRKENFDVLLSDTGDIILISYLPSDWDKNKHFFDKIILFFNVEKIPKSTKKYLFLK